MALDMYQASVPVFVRFLNNLSALLTKGAAHARDQGIDPADVIASRLYPDMLPLSAQVQIACDTAKRCGARLSDSDAPADADDESTFDELQARIKKTIAYLQSLPVEGIVGSDDKPVQLELPDRTLDFTGMLYLLNFALPNFFFHVSIAHGILRHNGVEIGKQDYMAGGDESHL